MVLYEFGFRELVPDQTIAEKWREVTLNTGGTQSTLQDIRVPERAGGYSYSDSSSLYTRNRFIYWRVAHDVLELVEQSLDVNLVGSHVRFKFEGTPILEGVSIHEMYNNVVVLVPTVSSTHRLVFPHPEKLQSRGSSGQKMQPSIFADATLGSVAQQFVINHTAPNAPLPHTAASYLGVNEDAVFAMGYSTGVILLIKMDYLSGMVTTSELKQTSIIDKIWPGFLAAPIMKSKPNEDEAPCAMVLHAIGLATYLFTLGQDGRLRIWSSETLACISVVDILDVSTEQNTSLIQGHQGHLLRKATCRDDNDVVLGAFLSFSDQTIFIVFRPILEPGVNAIDRIQTTYDNQGDLVDFWISSTYLWALWCDAGGETVIKHLSIERHRGPGTVNWLEVRQEVPPARDFDPALQHGGNPIDPRNAYLSYIFHPGMFPLAVINRALTIYRRSVGGATPTLLPEVAASVLRERVAVAVETEIANEIQEHEVSDEEFLDISWRCWSRFYSCCVQYYWAGTRPIAFLTAPSSHKAPGPLPGCPIGLVRKAQFSLFRPMDELEHLFVLGTKDCLVPSYNLNPVLSEPNLLDDKMILLMNILLKLENILGADIKETFLQQIHQLHSPDEVADQILHEIIGEDSLLTKRVVRSIFLNVNKEIVLEITMKILQMFDLDLSPGLLMDLNGDSMNESQCQNMTSMFSSQLGINVVAETLHQASNTRFSILRNLLLFFKLSLRNFSLMFENEEVKKMMKERINSHLVPRATVLLQGYYVLNWIGKVPCAPVTPTMLEASMQQMSVLSMTDKPAPLRGQRTLTLLSLFLGSKSVKYAHTLMALKKIEEEDLSQWHMALLPFAYLIGRIIWPPSSLFVFPEFLLTSCQYLLIQEYCRLLSPWCDCNASSRKFVLGSVLLDMGESEKACDLFLSASSGVSREDFLMSRLGQFGYSQTEPSHQQRKLVYYLKVMKMFEQMEQSDCVLRIAITAIEEAEANDSNLATLHSLRFSHLLRLGRHDSAYDAMLNNPDINRRRDSLRQLINSLVEFGQLELLTTLEYKDNMFEEAEEILQAKARSQDILHSIFYTVLHSIQVSKQNFRKAAHVMYEQALRLHRDANGIKSLDRQAKCLLACVNELSLVDKNYQWVLKPVPTAPSNLHLMEIEFPNASPKRSADGEQISMFSRSKPQREYEIVELDAIQREYEVVLAKLQLVGPDTSESTIAGLSHLSVDQLLGVLCGAGRFDVALKLASLHSLDKGQIFESITARCVMMTNDEGMSHSKSSDWLHFNNTRELLVGDPLVSNVGWKYLQKCLMYHEEKGRSVLHRAITSKLVHLEAFMPQWLLDSYKKLNIGELLQQLLSAGRLEEAGRLGCDLYHAGVGYGSLDFGMRGAEPSPLSVCMPHNVLEWALLELKTAVENKEGPQYEELYIEMIRGREDYLKKADRMSQEFKSIVTKNALKTKINSVR